MSSHELTDFPYTPTVVDTTVPHGKFIMADFDVVYPLLLRVWAFAPNLTIAERDALQRQLNMLETVRFHTNGQAKLQVRISEYVLVIAEQADKQILMTS